jgi:hypothetical protein
MHLLVSTKLRGEAIIALICGEETAQ